MCFGRVAGWQWLAWLVVVLKSWRENAMYKQFSQPRPEQYSTDEEYQEALEAYDAEMLWREQYAKEQYYERKFATANL